MNKLIQTRNEYLQKQLQKDIEKLYKVWKDDFEGGRPQPFRYYFWNKEVYPLARHPKGIRETYLIIRSWFFSYKVPKALESSHVLAVKEYFKKMNPDLNFEFTCYNDSDSRLSFRIEVK